MVTRIYFIRKFTACLLLVFFAITMTPRAWFHDLVATHKDEKGCSEIHNTAVLHQLKWDCDFDELVVSLPYTGTTVSDCCKSGWVNAVFCIERVPQYFYCFTPATESRGPPQA